MERDLNPWYNNNISNSQWEYTNNLIPPLIPPPIPQQNNNSALFQTYNNPYGYGSVPLNGFTPLELYPNPLCYNLPPPPLYNFPTIINNQPYLMNPMMEIPLSNQTIVNPTMNGTIDEMQEDSEEIDALLYSDSDEYNYMDELEEEASTGHSPVLRSNLITGEEVASTSIQPKKRRINTDFDASVMDTASSAKCCNMKNNDDHNGLDFSDAESSCVGEERERMDEEEEERETDCMDLKLKRKRIQETVGLLRRIIPGGKGKDAATILDEAISYLKSLKLKAKALGN